MVGAHAVALLLVRMVVGGTMIAHGINHYVLVLSVTSLAVAMLGPGRLSVDAAARITVAGWAGFGITLGVAVLATAGLLGTFWRPQPKAPEAAGEPAEEVHG